GYRIDKMLPRRADGSLQCSADGWRVDIRKGKQTMFRYVIALAALLFARSASADAFYKLVGYQCDREKDRIVISYRGAYNEDGEAMVQSKGPDEWEPESLIESMRDDDHIGELETIHRTCKLKDGVYTVSLGTSPGNFNIQGRCGAHFSAWV